VRVRRVVEQRAQAQGHGLHEHPRRRRRVGPVAVPSGREEGGECVTDIKRSGADVLDGEAGGEDQKDLLRVLVQPCL